jgi:putative DNA primase/helicase
VIAQIQLIEESAAKFKANKVDQNTATLIFRNQYPDTAPVEIADAVNRAYSPALDPYHLFPKDTKSEARWLVYRMEWNHGKNKYDKIPYNPLTGFKANSPGLGVVFSDISGVLKGYNGPGLYVEPPYIVIDIDNCRDKQTAAVADWVIDIIRELDTYAEASPSGTGIHIWLKGEKPGDACRKGIEIYSTKRFMTVTGERIPEASATINNRDITSVYKRMLAGEFQVAPASAPSTIVPSVSETPETPKAVKARAQIVPKGLRTTDLYSLLMHGVVTPEKSKPCVIENEGGSITYESRSEADMALCLVLANKNANAEAIDAEFRTSSLYRDKWERKDYRDSTIRRAIEIASRPASATNPVAPAVDDSEVEETQEQPLPDFPRLPGSLSEMCDAICPDIPYEFKIMAAVTHFGLIRSGIDTLEGEPHLQTRFYVCFVKDPGWGKTAALNEVRANMKPVGLNLYFVTPSVDSGPSLVDELSDCFKALPPMAENKAARLLIDPDEMIDLFEKAKVGAQSRNSLFAEFLKLYESNRTGNRSRSSGKSQVDNAHLAIIGGATTEGYPVMWTGTGGGATGLQSRFIPITTNAPKMPVKKRPTDMVALSASITRLQAQVAQPGQVIRISDDAATMLKDWWNGTARDTASNSRVDDMVKRLLIVLGTTNDTTVIGPDLMAVAIRFGDYVAAAREKYNPMDSYSWTQAFENLIQRTAERHKQPMTMNDFRRLVQPNRKPGGLGPFLQAWKNMLNVGILKADGMTHKGSVRYRL